MFIAKTKFDKSALVALQKQFINTSRTNDNDLVALDYVFDHSKTSIDVLKGPSLNDLLIHYTFFWAFEYKDLIDYQHKGIEIDTRAVVKDDGTPIWGCFLQGSLRIWIEYCESNHPKKFIQVVKDKLAEDGYTLRLGRNLCRIK